MRVVTLVFITSFAALSAGDVSITNEFAGMKAIYSGWKGNMTIAPSVADNTWKIELTDLPKASTTTGKSRSRLSIKKKFNDPNTVLIDTISADGSMESIEVKFPPGNDRAGCVRNIFIDGFVNTITIKGGDLGDSAAHDGTVRINGHIDSIKVKGKKYNVKHTKITQWWGGNVWADITATGAIKKIKTKGGNIHYDEQGGVFGRICSGGNMTLIAADGQVVKTDRSDSSSKAMFGGGINSEIIADGYEVKQIRAKGGTVIGSDINCRQIKKLKVVGQRVAKPRPFFPLSDQGVINTYVKTSAQTNYTHCCLKSIAVKNGSLRNSLFAVMGHAKTVKVTGEVTSDLGYVSNVIVRAGYDGPLSDNTPPDISPDDVTTSVYAETELVVPFTVNNANPSETLTVRIHNRGPALDASISNYNGGVFWGTNRWTVTSVPASGMFVWVSANHHAGRISNIVVRVRDDSVPCCYDDMDLKIAVLTSDVPPEITLDPPDQTRVYSLEDTADLSWTVTVYDVDYLDNITLSYDSGSLTLQTNQLAERIFYVWATDPAVGWYSNITFTATDEGSLTDTKTVHVAVVSNAAPVVTSSLTNDQVVCPISTTLDFQIIAGVTQPDSLAFVRPVDLPTNAAYTNATFHLTTAASNSFEWTPGSDDVGTSTWTFFVYNAGIELSAGKVSVTVIVTNGTAGSSGGLGRAGRGDTPGPRDAIGYYEGNINKVSIAGRAWFSDFIAGAQDTVTGDWQHANYLGRLKNVKVKSVAISNTFVSRKDIKIWKRDEFDYDNNEVWVSGVRR